jgi:uncharacterized protein (AIM24 family)
MQPINRNSNNRQQEQNLGNNVAYRAPPLAKIFVESGKSIILETGAMKAYQNLKMETGFHGSVSKIFSRMIGGENAIINRFTANEGKGWISLESEFRGQIIEHQLSPGEKIYFTRKAFIAGDSNVEITATSSGFTGFFSSMGLITTQASISDNQSGRIFLKSEQGQVEKLEINDFESPVIVDNTQIIGYSSNLRTEIITPGTGYQNPINSLTACCWGKEGISIAFTGKGTIYLGSNVKQQPVMKLK